MPIDTDPTATRPHPRLWERQPGESSRDYLDFLAWLELPQRHPLRQAAQQLKLPSGRLRSLSHRHRWHARATAFDDHRADVAQDALRHALAQQADSMQERAQRFRDQEWALHELMLQQANAVLDAFHLSRRRLPSVCDVVRLLELASTLGRRACGLPESGGRIPEPSKAIDPDFEAALNKIYGAAK